MFNFGRKKETKKLLGEYLAWRKQRVDEIYANLKDIKHKLNVLLALEQAMEKEAKLLNR